MVKNKPTLSSVASLPRDAFSVFKREGLRTFLSKSRLWLKYLIEPSKISLQNTIVPLCFPLYPNPKISIIIPAFNKSVYTFNCLLSILRETESPYYEVIVVDDCSNDDTMNVLSKIDNIKILRHNKNRGFVEACNKGASIARGDYLHFLNNDTVVTSGWLSSLLHTFNENSLAGAVGSKLIYPNYRLQEAGGIIWREGSSYNYGKFDDADKPEYNTLREVDYCSGASLMVRRTLFEEIGGFDLRFSPAYWEDTDLCFSIRKLGYKVYYQPASIVIHFEGITSGTNTASGMKRFQVVNRSKFIEKWSRELQEQHERKPENLILASDRTKVRI